MIMQTYQPKHTFFLLSFSNLLAAFGGGIILGKGIACIQTEYLKGGSVLAFFSGTVLGLIFLQSITASLSKLLTRYFSFFSSVVSILLLLIFNKYAENQLMTGYPAVIFFAFLSLRFSFWFYSRVRRAAEAAKIQHRIAWVELGYYIGIVSGLVLWQILDIPLSLSAALLLDALLQFLAGSIDLFGSVEDNRVAQTERGDDSLQSGTENNSGVMRVVTALTSLTVATQAVLFGLAHDVSPHIGTYMLAVFYTGVAVAAYLFKVLSIKLYWSKLSDSIFIQCNSIHVKLTLCLFSLTTFVCGSILLVKQFNVYLQYQALTVAALALLFLAFIAAFIYEIIALSIIDRVNIDYPHDRYTIIIKSYGFMGVGSAVALWFLSVINNSYLSLCCVLLLCVITGARAMMYQVNSVVHDETVLEI